MSMLAMGGTCVAFGASGAAETAFDARAFYLTGGARLYGFILFHETLANPAADGLPRFLRLVAEGSLVPRIELEAPWTEIGEIARRLIDRNYGRKSGAPCRLDSLSARSSPSGLRFSARRLELRRAASQLISVKQCASSLCGA